MDSLIYTVIDWGGFALTLIGFFTVCGWLGDLLGRVLFKFISK